MTFKGFAQMYSLQTSSEEEETWKDLRYDLVKVCKTTAQLNALFLYYTQDSWIQ